MKKTVIIDFNDSFTYNIYELLRRAGDSGFSVIPAGDLPELVSGSKIELPDRVILSPGPGIPEEYPAVSGLLEQLIAGGVPVLGICLGHQIIYRYFGGSLYNLEAVVHGQPRTVNVLKDDPLFNGIPKSFTAGLYHSWAAARPVPSDIEFLAVSDEGTIMAIRHGELPVWGVQFHPESFISEYGLQLLSNFLSL